MLGLTKKQFLKRSKECLDAEGIHSLIIRELIDIGFSGKTNPNESYRKVKDVMKDMDSIFSRYEKLSPPSNCIPTKLKILNSIILLQEAASAVYDHVYMVINNKNHDNEKLDEARLLLNNFREVFNPLSTEIGNMLNR